MQQVTALSDVLNDTKSKKGVWRLGPGHELQYKSRGKDEEVKLTGTLVAAEPGALVFSATAREANDTLVTGIHKLSGAWKLNAKNQITFEVEKERGKNDVLTFRNGWRINGNQEVVYTYREIGLKRKTKAARELVFKGHWDITEKNRLTYLLGANSGSAFRFRGAFQTPSLFAKKGEMRYQVGVEAAGRHRLRTLLLFGKWKLSRNLSVDFEIEYSDGRKRSIAFTKELFGRNGQMFLRLQKSLAESRVEAGVNLKW
jgi:hypothetical protein